MQINKNKSNRGHFDRLSVFIDNLASDIITYYNILTKDKVFLATAQERPMGCGQDQIEKTNGKHAAKLFPRSLRHYRTCYFKKEELP